MVDDNRVGSVHRKNFGICRSAQAVGFYIEQHIKGVLHALQQPFIKMATNLILVGIDDLARDPGLSFCLAFSSIWILCLRTPESKCANYWTPSICPICERTKKSGSGSRFDRFLRSRFVPEIQEDNSKSIKSNLPC